MVVDLLGYTHPEELLGHKILEFTHPDHRADWQELQQRLWAHKLPHFALETCLVRADGSSFWCQVTSILFPNEGGELGYTILEDISARKHLEANLRRLHDAQETILQLATHDLKGPIAHIELLVDLLQREVASRSGEGPPPEMVALSGAYSHGLRARPQLAAGCALCRRPRRPGSAEAADQPQ